VCRAPGWPDSRSDVTSAPPFSLYISAFALLRFSKMSAVAEPLLGHQVIPSGAAFVASFWHIASMIPCSPGFSAAPRAIGYAADNEEQGMTRDDDAPATPLTTSDMEAKWSEITDAMLDLGSDVTRLCEARGIATDDLQAASAELRQEYPTNRPGDSPASVHDPLPEPPPWPETIDRSDEGKMMDDDEQGING